MSWFGRRRHFAGWTLALVLVAAASLLWPFTSTAPGSDAESARVSFVATRAHPLRVLLMGDSLANASHDFFSEAVGASGRAVVDSNLVRGGSAICDWLPVLADELRTFAPHVAVVQLSGNNLTQCMTDPATNARYEGAAWLEKYRADARAAMAIFHRFGVEVYWIGSPPTRDDAGAQGRLNAMYRRLARRSTAAHFVNAGSAVLAGGKHYTDYLPCKAHEPCTDVNPETGRPAARVRGPDGGHFCPNGAPAFSGITEPCTVWSSGAWRFGTAMARGIVRAYGL